MSENNIKKEKTGMSGIWIFLIVVLSLIIIGFIGYYIYNIFSDESNETYIEYDNADVINQTTINKDESLTTEKENWKIYSNDQYGYEISMPNNFSVVDDCYDSVTGKRKDYQERAKWLVIIDRNLYDNFPYCDSDFPQMEIVIRVFDNDIDINKKMEYSDTDIEDEVKIGNNVWARQIMTEKSEFDETYTTNLYLNKDGKGYFISIENTDGNGSHDEIIDEIIETITL